MKWLVGIGLALGLAAFAAGTYASWRAAQKRAFDAAIGQARLALDRGRAATARRLCEDLTRRHPSAWSAWLLLGDCDLELGRLEQAEQAWSQIPPDQPEAAPAAIRRARLFFQLGRLAEAEAVLPDPSRWGAGSDAALAAGLLGLLLKTEGRLDEARSLYRHWFQTFESPVEILRELWNIDHGEFPVERIRADLARAHREVPEDDRVWLGLAHLATITGKLEEAQVWLNRCLQRRPEDQAVLKAQLRWAVAANDPSAAARALSRLTPESLEAADLLELSAWFAGPVGDLAQQKEALNAALKQEPGRRRLLDQLAGIEQKLGHADSARALRDRKARLDREAEAYELILFDENPERRATEAADLAHALGWKFEADRWSDLATPDARKATDPPLPSVGTNREDRPDVRELLSRLREQAKSIVRVEAGKTARSVPRFVDRAREVGLSFAYEPGGLESGRPFPEMMGGGVALLDFDGDGWLDVFLPQGGSFPPEPGTPNRDRLFRNKRDGSFEDVTEASGIAALPSGYGFGPTAGDFDGDGHTDLLISRWRSLQLLRNRGDGTFEDATESAGLADSIGWPSSAAFADLDADGDLDLYICQYVEFDPAVDNARERPLANRANEGNPLRYPSLPDRLYRNDAGRFVDISGPSGIGEADTHGRGLGVVVADLDDDGRLDLYVANDMTANFLFLNRGDLRFDETAELAGAAAGADGGYQASMGLALADPDADGRLDLAVTNFYNEGTTFYRNLGGGQFADQTAAVGLLAPTRFVLGFGLAFVDADLDGHVDLVQANGHVNDNRPSNPFGMPTQLFQGREDERFEEVTERAGEDLSRLRVSRGLAVGDLDNDGRPDLLVVPQDGPVVYLHNETTGPGRSLVLQLQARATAASAEGARVKVVTAGASSYHWRFGGGSYQSSSDPRLFVGIGSAEKVEQVEVRWPSGRVDRYKDLTTEAPWLLIEGQESPVPSPAK